MNIKEVESQLASKLEVSLRHFLDDLNYPLPADRKVRVSLVSLSHAKGQRKTRGRRKTRSDASANNWSPNSGLIEIQFESLPGQEKQLPSEVSQRPVNSSNAKPSGVPEDTHPNSYVHPAEAELLRALDRAESKPGWNFVPLKKFRDEILPTEPPEDIPSLRTDVEQRHMLQSVIDKRLVLVGKVPNPKAPQFPVTTIRLNRLMPEVKAVLGHGGDLDQEFRPVEIRGEPLSATILRERR